MIKNPQIEYEFALKRGRHPYLSALYLNGFERDIPVLNKDHTEILEMF